jgi:uncharacterized membrane protein YbhN (UPF0104 family)
MRQPKRSVRYNAGDMDVLAPSDRRTWLLNALRLLLGAAIVVWAAWNLDWAALQESLSQLRLGWVAAAMVSFLLSLALKLLRWRGLLAWLRPRIGWLTLTRAFFFGQAINILGLGRWGDMARVIWLRRESGTSGIGIATSVIAEKLLDVIFLGLAALGWLVLWLEATGSASLIKLLGLSGLCAVALGLLAWQGQPLLSWLNRKLASWRSPLGRWLAPRVGAVVEGMAGLTQRRQLGRSLLLSLTIWIVMALTNLLLLGAFSLPLSGRLALSVLVSVHLGAAANLTPANIGPVHWAVMLALTMWGVAQSTALTYALVLHAMLTLLPLGITLALHGWHWPHRQGARMRTLEN